MLAIHGRHIVEPVDKRNDLIIGKILGVFFEATVKVPDVWHDLPDNLAVKEYFETKDTVSRWVLWSQVDDHLLRPKILSAKLVRFRLLEAAGMIDVLNVIR